jgi:death-on-curing protein
MRILTKDEIIFLNKNNISKYGGNFVPPYNLLHENPLDYLVEIVDANLFGEPIYPEVYHKAGVYLFNIISNHIFTDGNKRTGLDACLLFLDYNGYQLSEMISNETLTDFILSVASGNQSLETVQDWLKSNSSIKQ